MIPLHVAHFAVFCYNTDLIRGPGHQSRSPRNQSDQSPIIIACISDWWSGGDGEKRGETAVFIIYDKYNHDAHLNAPASIWRVESAHWVAVFSVTWVMFILGVTLCVFITWYLSDMSCLHHALTGMLWLQYTNSVGVENCVDRWLASLQGSKHLQNVLNKLSNNILWNFYFLDSRQGSQGRMDSNQLILSRMLDQGI